MSKIVDGVLTYPAYERTIVADTTAIAGDIDAFLAVTDIVINTITFHEHGKIQGSLSGVTILAGTYVADLPITGFTLTSGTAILYGRITTSLP